MRRSSLALFVGIVAVVGLLVWSMTRQARVECEVCIAYAGRSACRVAAARDRGEAAQAATTAACAVLSSGVTETVACQGTRPAKLFCREP